jgi:hypothetical protein
MAARRPQERRYSSVIRAGEEKSSRVPQQQKNNSTRTDALEQRALLLRPERTKRRAWHSYDVIYFNTSLNLNEKNLFICVILYYVETLISLTPDFNVIIRMSQYLLINFKILMQCLILDFLYTLQI